MDRVPFTISTTHNTQQYPRQQIQTVKFVRQFVINSITLAVFRREKFPDLMVAFGSRAVTSTMTADGFWKKLKAQPTARFWIRSFTATTQRAGKLVTLSLTPPANYSAVQAALLLAPRPPQKPPDKRHDAWVAGRTRARG